MLSNVFFRKVVPSISAMIRRLWGGGGGGAFVLLFVVERKCEGRILRMTATSCVNS